MDKPAPHRPLSRFILRTPALPFETLSAWSGGRVALARLVDDPAIREALYLASPELDAQIAAWQREPESQAGIAVERALVRYISRMAARSTPFGLFAAVSVGTAGADTQLAVPPRAATVRHTRLDNDLLFALCADLARDPAARAKLRFRINSSIYLAAARLRYAEARLVGTTRAYHLVAVDRSAYLDAVLERARPGATLDELAEVLCADPEITSDDARAFLGELIDAQLLVPELAPAVTGRKPTAGIIETLRAQDLEAIAMPLELAANALREIDAAPSNPPGTYKALEELLARTLPTKVEANRLFQVDLFKPAPNVRLGQPILDELARSIELLHALTPATPDDAWTQFRTRFAARYETREVPLLEALDEESGIGFGETGESPRANPLLADLAFPTRLSTRTAPLGVRDVYLLSLVARALQERATEIELTDEDVVKLTEPRPLPLGDVLAVQCQLAARSAEALAAGDYQIRVVNAGRGASLLGRFCHGSPEVAALTGECVRIEDAATPEAIHAEIVHLPEGRVGNILLRPVLREYEIAYLGTSGADLDKQIDVADLVVSVAGDRVVLRSKRLDREVIPRLTSAHNYSARSLGVYRFLCSHATQGLGDAYWTWGGIVNEMPFLPRIRRGKIVLERARWILHKKDLAPIEAAFAGLGAAKTPEQIRGIRAKVGAAVAALRARLGLPRWIVVGDGDNELPVDLDNELMVESAAHLLKGRTTATIFELLPAPDQLCAHGSEGTFAHELVVMLARTPAIAAPTRSFLVDPATPRRFSPGSEWLYVKLYTGRATADALLRDYLAPAIRSAIDRGLADSWFFLRYSDPEWHVRLRFAGDPAVLTGELLPALHAALAPAGERGLVWRLVLDTYEREVERYGGHHGISLAEQLFRADSDCVLAILEALEGDAGADATWRLALRGIDRLMDDLGLSLDDKLLAMTVARDQFGAEVGMDTAFQKRLGEKYRAHRAEIIAVLDDDPAHAFAPIFPAFATRSHAQQAIARQLRALESEGRLNKSVLELAHSFVHMHVNRMIRGSQRLHELVLYDLLRRHYEGVVARTKHRKAS